MSPNPMPSLSVLCLCAVLSLSWACGGKKDPLLAEAAQLQQQAAAIHDEVMVQLDDAERLAQKLRVKREAADSTARTPIDSALARLQQSRTDMDQWMDEAAEVDGAAQHHAGEPHHAADKKHDHGAHAPHADLSPQQLRDIRLEMKQRMEKLQSELKARTETAKKLL